MSVVVPAFNEAPALRRLLPALVRDADGRFEVFVVANGCTDESAQVARACGAPVRVLETAEANKHRAMRLADEAAGADRFPRFYVDADVEISARDVVLLAEAMAEGGLLAVAPERTVPTGGCPWSVRWFYDVWLRLPVIRAGLFGRGVIGVSALGHARLAELPELMGDDLAASLAFADHERAVVPGAKSVVYPPRTYRDLIRRRTRVATVTAQAGARPELAAAGATARTGGGDLAALLRRQPLLAPKIAWFAFVAARSRRAARGAIAGGDFHTWLRDESSRGAPAPTGGTDGAGSAGGTDTGGTDTVSTDGTDRAGSTAR
ncbi:MAG TPA: glycosyltransferase family 2 protein [Actinospica sp.]|nr:glycosyltransferase family 2 protein [Actinospica sp.]